MDSFCGDLLLDNVNPINIGVEMTHYAKVRGNKYGNDF